MNSSTVDCNHDLWGWGSCLWFVIMSGFLVHGGLFNKPCLNELWLSMLQNPPGMTFWIKEAVEECSRRIGTFDKGKRERFKTA